MKQTDSTHQFIPAKEELERNLESGNITWESPSNIALVKYWGKYGDQLPSNASLSLTLNACSTKTALAFERADKGGEIAFHFEGKRNDVFGQKTIQFFERVKAYFPFIEDYNFIIDTSNTFPHSSGIASSASGMSAVALCLTEMERMLRSVWGLREFERKASFASRLGSGSACRSIYGGLAMWGEHSEYAGSSQLYAIPYVHEVHPVFKSFQDVILLIDRGEKVVSSTVGHGLLAGHPFSETRFEVAQKNMANLKAILNSGDVEAFGALVEAEALMLHAMMLTSSPNFILMKPNTLAVIEKIRNFRTEKGVPVFFTLDAGANVHILFPENVAETVMGFIENELIVYCQDKQYICDNVGEGPKQLTPEL